MTTLPSPPKLVSRPPSGVAREREVARLAATGARGHDLAVGLDRHGVGRTSCPTEVDQRSSVAIEARVEAAVGVVAGEREVGGCHRRGVASRDDLAVAWMRHAGGAVILSERPSEVGDHLAVAVEARVEAAVGVVARQREVDVIDAGDVAPTATILPSACTATP